MTNEAAIERPKPKTPEPCAIVIFGAFGDLTKRLVMPAIYNLGCEKILPDNIALIGVDLAEGDATAWTKHLREMLESFVGNTSSEFNVDHIEEDTWQALAKRMDYVRGDMTKPDLYADIGKALDKAGFGQGNVIFYFAIADRFFATVAQQLGKAGLTKAGDAYWRRVVVEKPFGHDVASAKALNASLLETLQEDQIFRIDHFLGKETVQSIMAFRFANGMFEPIWNRDRIDHVQITASEVVGVEARGKFYEVTGALRDMVPNHLFTLLAMVAMDPPVTFDAMGIRNRKAEVFTAMPPLKPGDAVRGQYEAGDVGGKATQAYRKEPNVAPDSDIETYVAMRVEIDSWRWAGVPFYLRTGKRMPSRVSEIVIQFREVPLSIFGAAGGSLSANQLVIRLQPDEGVKLYLMIKDPGPGGMRFREESLNLSFAETFKGPNPDAYERLLMDVIRGSQALFMRRDEVEAAWMWADPILDAWSRSSQPLAGYTAGVWGPSAAVALIERDGRTWHESPSL